ncbi:MAG TPA: Hsp20 family protein [Terriglobia bacterium]|nr:Hsp20 family protein [Terriglobia bacterium]
MKRQTKAAGKLDVLKNNDPISAETEDIQNRIRQRAYELSQIRGHSGREVEDWLSAESEIIFVPPVEMMEKGRLFQVQLAIPGINADDVHVMATPDQILIKCEFSHHHDSDSGIVHVCDFKSATVFRTIHFPEPIDVRTIDVEFQDGMLRITAKKQRGGVESMTKRQPARKSTSTKSPRSTRGAA